MLLLWLNIVCTLNTFGKVRSKRRLLVYLILPILAGFHQLDKEETDITTGDYYQRGLKEKESGNYKDALEIWERAQEKSAPPDFKIGQSYIQLVTEQKISSKYKTASEIYFWGLSDEEVKRNKDFLLTELEYLESIISYKTYKDWKKKIKKNDDSVFDDIHDFWLSKDLTPLTQHNERLLEHWERVAYAKKHFPKKDFKGMDDRGGIYIKYGEADLVRKGMLLYNPSTVSFLLRDRIDVDLTSFSSSPAQESMKQAMLFNLDIKIRELHSNPTYEVWIYKDLKERRESTIFLFGSNGSSGVFRTKESVEDFIPSEAFSMTNRNKFLNISLGTTESSNDEESTGIISRSQDTFTNSTPSTEISPGLIMQIMYYRQFAALDYYFGTRYNEMLKRYQDKATRISKSLAREFEHVNESTFKEMQARAPEEISIYDYKVNQIPMDVFAYRFLDSANTPYLKLFCISEPGHSILYHQLKDNPNETSISYGSHKLDAGLFTIDEEGGLVETKAKSIPDLLLEKPSQEVGFVFDFYTPDEVSRISFVNELYANNPSDGNTQSELPDNLAFTGNLLGIGNEELQIPEPLESNDFTLSDLILGYKSSASHNNEFMPFEISHHQTIPKGKELHLYYELYNLEREASGRAKFTFTYSIQSKKRGLLKLFGDSKDEIKITVNEESTEKTFKNTLVIDTSELDQGEYLLNIEVRNAPFNKTLNQTLPFFIE